MSKQNIQNKPNEGMQKGERRQRLHGNQNNVGNAKNPKTYGSMDESH